MDPARKGLIAISGPSCGGKGPLLAAVNQFHAEMRITSFSVIKCRESRASQPRPDEAGIWDDPDYFRTRVEIESLVGDRYVHAVSHGFPQVLDLQRVASAPTRLVVLEACQEITRQLPSSDYLREVDVTTVFVSPLGCRDIQYLRACDVDVAEYVKGLQVTRLLARAAFHQRPVDDAFLADVAVRARDAVEELRTAHLFNYVLVNRAGEGSPEWNRDAAGNFQGRPLGEAAAALEAFVQLFAGRPSPALENWQAQSL
ncbi:MAG: hypothetical protein GXX96_02100 [Planctomycetaceae bacterium]|nr:hypothetical protein [Planctomycetaceae bacterium]